MSTLRAELEALLAELLALNKALEQLPGRRTTIGQEIAGLRVEVEELRASVDRARRGEDVHVEELEDLVTLAYVRGIAIRGRFIEPSRPHVRPIV